MTFFDNSSSARAKVTREALIFTPMFLLLLAGWVVSVIVEPNAIALLVMLGLLTLLIGFQSVQAVRDLFAKPQVSRGDIRRKWSHRVVNRGFYVYVAKNVFNVGPLAYMQLKEDDLVSITHYPHTNVIISIRKEEGEPGPEEDRE